MFHTHARTRTRTHTFSFSFSLSFSFFLSLPPFLSFSFSFSFSLSLSFSLSFDFQQARFIEEIKMRLCVWSTLRWNLMAPQISRRHTRNANGFNSSVHAALATTPERGTQKKYGERFLLLFSLVLSKNSGRRERERRERGRTKKREKMKKYNTKKNLNLFCRVRKKK
jgi:hypothetical protein